MTEKRTVASAHDRLDRHNTRLEKLEATASELKTTLNKMLSTLNQIKWSLFGAVFMIMIMRGGSFEKVLIGLLGV